jgi:hypothetical protein
MVGIDAVSKISKIGSLSPRSQARVLPDGDVPGLSRGADVDENGTGVLREGTQEKEQQRDGTS